MNFGPPPEGDARFLSALRETRWRFEIFAGALGAKNVSSMDVSTYEGATLIHDLNQPVPPELEERFDVVIDGGMLEHIFQFPVAIDNSMKMLKPGGHLILLTVANNNYGHGFYQFSPELVHRVLSPENGFEIARMIALENGLGRSSLLGVKYDFYMNGPWFDVRDPAEIQERVTLLNHKPVSLFVLARKKNRAVLFRTIPQQSDYVPQWQAGKAADSFGQSSFGQRIIGWLRRHVSEQFHREWLPRLAWPLDPFRLWRFRRSPFANRKFYRRVKS